MIFIYIFCNFNTWCANKMKHTYMHPWDCWDHLNFMLTLRKGVCNLILSLKASCQNKIYYVRVKFVQSTLSHQQSPPEWMQSQCNCGSFLSKSDLHDTIIYTMRAQNCPNGKRQWLLKSEQFAISRWSALNRGKKLWDVWYHVANINIQSNVALKEKKAYQSHWITLHY